MAAFFNSPSHLDVTGAVGFSSPKFSPEKTFVQPKDDNLLRPGLVGNKNQQKRGVLSIGAPKSTLNLTTPSRPPLGDKTNRKSAGEFTPLLKSVHKSNMGTQIDARINAAVARTPMSLKHMELYAGGTPLPRGDSSGIDASSYNDDSTPLGPNNDDSGDVSTPIPRIGGKAGMLDDGQLTLREQEKIIDDIKKENFSLKLKIFFLDEKLNKLGPEFNDVAIRENIEMKVEHTTLRAELKRLKKALLDSEKLVMELQGDAQSAQVSTQKKIAQGKQAEIDQAKIRDLMAELEDKNSQMGMLKDENERLRLELQDRDGTEREDAETIESLNRRVADLEGEKEDLEAEIRAKEEQLDNRQDSQDKENDHLRDRIRELEEELQAKYDEEGNEQEDAQARIQELQEELSGKDEEIKTLQDEHEAQIASARQQYQQKKQAMKTLQDQKDSLELRLATMDTDREGCDNELADRVMDLEHDNRRLQNEIADIKDDIDEAISQRNRIEEEMAVLVEKHQEEVQRIRDEHQERSIYMKSAAQDRENSRQGLQSDLVKLQEDLASMTTLHREKSSEVDILKRRIAELSNDFGGDVKALQIEITGLQEDKERTKRHLEDTESQKNLLQLRHNALTTESQELQKDLNRLTKELGDLKSSLANEKQKSQGIEQSLKAQLSGNRNALESEIDKLRSTLETRNKDLRSKSDDWSAEKRQLELRLTTAEQKVKGYEKTITNLRESEGTLQGHEMKLANEMKSLKAVHGEEIASLNLQITDLNLDLDRRRQMLEKNAGELQVAKDELRQVRKNERALDDRIRTLEDEVRSASQNHSIEMRDIREQLTDAESQCGTLKSEVKTYKDTLAIAQSQLRNEQLNYQSSLDSLKNGSLSQEQLKIDLANMERRLESALKDRQSLHEQLLNSGAELASLRADCQELEIEREELRAQIKDLVIQIGTRTRMDQEKVELRLAKNKLERGLQSLTNERDELFAKAEELELNLEEAMTQAVTDEQKLEDEISELKAQVRALSDARDRELSLAKREAARLETRIGELQDAQADLIDPMELSEIKKDLDDSKKRETDFKEKIRDQRQRIARLETDLKEAKSNRSRPAPDDTDALIERRELHQHLVNAKLQIEQLQGDVETKDSDLDLMLARESELVARIKALKSDRSKLKEKTTKAEEALLKSQSRLERAQEKLTHMQKVWDDERNLFEQKVVQNDVLTQKEMQLVTYEQQKNHKAEMRGLATQIKWLRIRIEREEKFKRDLAYQKHYFLKQMEMYSACNKLQRQMVEEMGIFVDRRSRQKRPKLKTVGLAVLAVQRMKIFSGQWAANKVLKASLVKSLEKVRPTGRK
ncbi:hypothetical protein TWF102_007660 [Orbilia oligospora]|uniref:Centrosomin N-terminal motif 1 domain-containing protein n=1 Tax=Orbilia oligospora TaxID=2813651 RepID=A0A7C8N801_ORBOL|nr:hypothetical protein TWF103_011928 [Orbilia oligospora]KAF3094154.1 hypothetical protein TWF102_007660 [Orbilia oligospora]